MFRSDLNLIQEKIEQLYRQDIPNTQTLKLFLIVR